MHGETSFNKAALISSYPGAPFFRDFIIIWISSEVTSLRQMLFVSGWPMKSLGDRFWSGIFAAKFGPKKSLNLLLITEPSVVKLPSFNLNLVWDCLYSYLLCSSLLAWSFSDYLGNYSTIQQSVVFQHISTHDAIYSYNFSNSLH